MTELNRLSCPTLFDVGGHPSPGTFFQVLNASHPVTQSVSTNTPWSDFRVHQYWQLTPDENDSVLIQYAGTTHAAMVERVLREDGADSKPGHVLAITTPIPALAPTDALVERFVRYRSLAGVVADATEHRIPDPSRRCRIELPRWTAASDPTRRNSESRERSRIREASADPTFSSRCVFPGSPECARGCQTGDRQRYLSSWHLLASWCGTGRRFFSERANRGDRAWPDRLGSTGSDIRTRPIQLCHQSRRDRVRRE